MSAWGSIGPGTRILVMALGGAALAGAGVLVWQATRPFEPAPLAEAAPAEPAPSVAPVAGVEETAPVEDVPAPVTAPVLPKIDTWRVAPDGEALVAGMALPGAKVGIVVDDRPVAEGVALASGEFVLQFTLPPNPDPSLLQLAMTPADGVPVLSPDLVALGPIAGPELAVAEPEPEPMAEPASTETASVQPEPEPEAAPAALLLTDEGAVVLQDPASADPAPAGQVVIDTVAYTPTGSVQVGGRGDAGSALRLYLDNAEIGVATVADDGTWLVTLNEGAPGIYTLRVDQIDAAGKVTARFETPFKRETPDALAAVSGTDMAALQGAPATVVPETPAPDAEPPAPAESTPEPTAKPVTEPAALAESSPPPSVTITVQPGFTLWGIAQERMGDGMYFVQVFDANRDRIKDPNLIYPGQVFSIPADPTP